MRVVVPYAGHVHPLTRRVLAELAPEAEFFECSADPTAYHTHFGRWWRDGESFLVVEHDVEPSAQALAQAKGCPCPWSRSPYPYRAGWRTLRRSWMASLGFARFSAELLAALPDAGDEISIPLPTTGPRRDWFHLDLAVAEVLGRRGVTPHDHADVGHHHRWVDDGGWCSCGAAAGETCRAGAYRLFGTPEPAPTTPDVPVVEEPPYVQYQRWRQASEAANERARRAAHDRHLADERRRQRMAPWVAGADREAERAAQWQLMRQLRGAE